eukprot:645573-Rhodomonas_salina.1
MLHSGCKVHFEISRPGDHQFGGVIQHQNGTEINMIYHGYIWRLPVLTKETASALHHHTYVASIRADSSWILTENPYRALLELANKVELVRASTNPVDMEK